MSVCDKYNLAEDRLKAFTRSAIRTKILLCLKDRDMDSSELGEELGSRTTTILHLAKDMIETGQVKKNNRGLSLTNLGKIQAMLIDKLVSAIVVLDKHKDFWQTHDISGIPEEILANIGMLEQFEIVASDSSAPLRVHENFLADLDRAKEIHGVSPVIYPGYSEAISKAIKRGVCVDLVLTNKILDIVAKDYTDLGRELLTHDNFRLYSIDVEVKEAFTVTDTLLSLGFFRLNGDYDVGNDLICKGDMARKWGMKLFNHYLNVSKRVNII